MDYITILKPEKLSFNFLLRNEHNNIHTKVAEHFVVVQVNIKFKLYEKN